MAMLPRMLSTLGQGVRRPLAQSLSTTGSLPFGAVSMYSWSTTMPSAPPAGSSTTQRAPYNLGSAPVGHTSHCLLNQPLLYTPAAPVAAPSAVPHGGRSVVPTFNASAVLDAYLEVPAPVYSPSLKDMLPEADPNNEDNEGAPARDTILAIKRTFQPSTIRRKRQHGFLVRLRSREGRKILNRRRHKGRKRLGL